VIPTRLAAVLHVALNPVTGPWSVMRELSKAQAASGLYASVGLGIIVDACWPMLYQKELQASGLPHYWARTPGLIGTAQFLWQRIQRPPIDHWVDDMLTRSGAECCVVHFHNAWLSGAFLPLRCVEQKRARVVVTFHGVNAQLNGRPIRRWLHRWMASRLPRYEARLTSVDASNLGLAESVLHLERELFQTVPNGLTEMPQIQSNEWMGKGEFRVGHVGSIMERKGWRLAADAVLLLAAEGLKIRLLIAGSGPEDDKAKALAKEHPQIIEFLGHVKDPRANLLPCLHALSIMSVHEGLPMSLIEAMSVGLPVVATSVGGIPEAVTHERTGLLIPRTCEALAEAIRALYNSPEKCSRLGRAARKEFDCRFELGRIVKEYDVVYRGALALA
jgi:glycosyltransferase involved in cell wall biosynthesis